MPVPTFQRWRRISQGFFLLLFFLLFLKTESKGNDELGYPVRLFLDFDPLILLSSLLASHHLTVAFLLSLFLIVATMLFGRIFCGWACPFGTLHDAAGSLRKARCSTPSHGYRYKYYLLAFLLASSLFTLQLTGLFDPMALLIRSLSLGLYPALNYGLHSFFHVLYRADPLGASRLTEPVYDLLKETILSFSVPVYRQGVIIGVFFLILLGLNLWKRRLWCTHLCPLGALLGILSRYALLKRQVSGECTSCGECSCRYGGGPAPEAPHHWPRGECLLCGACLEGCTPGAVRFRFGTGGTASPDLDRRRVVAAALSGVAALPLLRATPLAKIGSHNPLLVRPPGSLEERDFLERCVKCGECMKVCITNGLQPTLLEAGLEGIWSPLLVPRIGYCEYRCTLCGQVCPTGAIKRLALPEKVRIKIGLAMIDKGLCLPWAHARPCIVCEEVCPTPKKAIWFEDAVVKDRRGMSISLKQPHVDLELCIGCGICETKCPVLGTPAIAVTSLGESRSSENRLLLDRGGIP